MCVSIPSSHFWTLWLLAALAISCTGQVVFDLPDNAKPLRHIAVDNNTGDVFLGAKGYTFKLDQNLTEVASVLTKHESNKVLLISEDKVVDCGTNATKPACFLRDLNNITSFTTSSPSCWPTNSTDDDTVSYITEFNNHVGDTIERGVVYSASKQCYSNNGQYPWISVRELDGSTTNIVSQQIKFLYQDIFFKGGFTTKKHSYFLTNQERYPPEATELVPSGSRIIQLCNSPPSSGSFPYTDMPLVCSDGQTEYKWIQAMTVLKANSYLANGLDINQEDEVLVTAFSSDNGTRYVHVQSPSAICLFTMKEIRARLNATRTSCAENKGEGYIATSQTCEPNPAVLDFIPLIGHLNLTASPVFTTSSVITSLASVVTATITVVLAGTEQGHVHKISLSYPSGSFEYDDEVIDEGHPVKSNLLLSPLRDYALAMTQNKVVRLSLYEGCMENNNNTNCAACIDTGNTLCGWCVMEGRCSSEDNCSGAQQENHWLRATDDVCVNMSLSTYSIRVEETDQLDVTINTMPKKPADISYACAFDNSAIATTTQNGNEFHCQIPLKQPSFIPNSDAYRVVEFSMKSNGTGNSFVYHNFFYYECSRFTSCFGCTDPRFDCTWCVAGNRCTHAACDANDIDLTNTQKDLCPQIHETDTTLIPNNVSKEITVIGSNLPNSGTYKCHLSNQQEVPARWINDTTLLCEAHKYAYTDRIKEIITTLTVTWGGFQIDNKNYPIKVTLYKCEFLGSDCSSCQAAVVLKPYECSACTDHTKCTYQETSLCGTDMSCPAPTISRIQPNSGPTAGGTTITIDGEELGRNVADIGYVTVMGRECNNVQWTSSTRITCTTSASTETGAGSVVVSIRNKDAIPYNSFAYKDPDPQFPDPNQGQQSGGTIITFRGDNLNIGSDHEVLVDGKKCTEIQASIVITCRVPPLDLAHRNKATGVSVNVTLMIDDFSEVFNFTYQPDPVVTSIQPDISFESGGRELVISGERLNIIQETEMIVGKANESCWMNADNSSLTCPSPNYAQTKRRRRKRDAKLVIKFKMDGVTYNTTFTITFVVDPKIFNLTDDGAPISFQELLTINGANISRAATTRDVTVSIGGLVCEVTSVNLDSIKCEPDQNAPNDTMAPVDVQIGNIYRLVGFMDYYKPPVIPDYTIIIASVITVAVLLAVVIVLSTIYFMRIRKIKSQNRNLLNKIGDMERDVSEVCRGDYLEMQTYITSEMEHLVDQGVPYHSYQSYIFNMLFPTDVYDSHYLLFEPSVSDDVRPNLSSNMAHLEQLLHNKFFLLSVIRTLEKEKDMNLQDKANFTSLLSIAFLGKMDYCAEILWSLMSELIDNSCEKKHQKTFFRRSETIAEKYLSNWLALCMYNYLVDHAGSALFMLYKATMIKMHSGPICAVTGNAKCTLSEQKLLKSQVDHEVVNLNVELNTDIFSCSVLSCDTITQVKDKCLRTIYKNMVASDIPRENGVDLEWRQGQGGHLILQDIDVTSIREGGCTKLNTLEHYNVLDGSMVALLSREPLSEGYTDVDMDESVASLASISPLILAEEKRGSTPWHLIKPETDENENEMRGALQDIYLNRMVQTKFALKECMDQFFNAVLDASYVPLVVKYLFQYLEREALEHEVKDPDITHNWKSNSYPVRFLSQLIMKPECVFDIHKPETINQCLDVLAQAFNDSFSTSHQLLKGKNKASSMTPSRLVFTGQVESIYKPQVNAMFQILSDGDQISEQEVMVTMNALSKFQKSNTHFKKTTALYKIYEYLEKYKEKICDELSENTDVRQLNLAEKLNRIIKNMSPESLYDD